MVDYGRHPDLDYSAAPTNIDAADNKVKYVTRVAWMPVHHVWPAYSTRSAKRCISTI